MTPTPKISSAKNSAEASRNGNRNMPPSTAERRAGDARRRSMVPVDCSAISELLKLCRPTAAKDVTARPTITKSK